MKLKCFRSFIEEIFFKNYFSVLNSLLNQNDWVDATPTKHFALTIEKSFIEIHRIMIINDTYNLKTLRLIKGVN